MLKAGFSVGIQIWIVFLIVLFLLHYSAGFSILFGAIAGFAGGVVAGYFRTPNQAPAQLPDDGANTPLKKAQQRLQKWRIGGDRRDDKARPRSWFGRRPRKTLRSRQKSSDSKS